MATRNTPLLVLLSIVSVLAFLSVMTSVRAVPITDCTWINATGTYTLQNDIYADTNWRDISSVPVCIYIGSPYAGVSDVTLDLNGYTIYGNGAYPKTAIVVQNVPNTVIQNGQIRNFINATDTIFDGGAIVTHNSNNLKIINIQAINDTIGLDADNGTNAVVMMMSDSPLAKVGVVARYMNYSHFNLYSRSQRWALYVENSSNSSFTGTFETNIVNDNLLNVSQDTRSIWTRILDFFTKFNEPYNAFTRGVTYVFNQGSALGQLALSDNYGFGIDAHSVTNCNFTSISANGEQGIVLMEKSTKNFIAKIQLPNSGKVSYFGGIYLGEDATNNTMCEVSGIIFDWCNQGDYNTACPQKANVYYDDCASVNPVTFEAGSGLAGNIFLTPFLGIDMTGLGYPFLSFFITPFFFAICIATGSAVYLGKKSNNVTWAGYMLVIAIILLSVIMVSYWFAILFVVLAFWILTRTGSLEGVLHR